MFTGNINQLPDEHYLSKALLEQMKIAFAAIEKDASFGKKILVENVSNYTVVEDICSAAKGKPAEIHEDYLDIHLVLSGKEQIGYSNQPLVINDDSKASSDLYFGELEEENYVSLTQGEFAVFYPGEVHKPMSDYDNASYRVKKAIIKIRFDTLS